MSSQVINSKQQHLAATGTGSLFLDVQSAPHISIIVTKLTASQTADFELYGCNYVQGAQQLPPGITTDGSKNTATGQWAPITEVVPVSLTGSSLAAVATSLSDVPFKWLELRTRSVQGGVFRVDFHKKG
jgi:hypothetical protein